VERCCIKIFLFLLLLGQSNQAQDIDTGVPDSALFYPVEILQIHSCGTVNVEVPICVYSDNFLDHVYFVLDWGENAYLDTVMYFPTGTADSLTTFLNIIQDEHRLVSSVTTITVPGLLGPTNGTELLMKLYFTVEIGDSLEITFPESLDYRPRMANLSQFWLPKVFLPDTTLSIPTLLQPAPGDADASGAVSISDAVFIINFIFGGGCAPYDLNSADPDGSCGVSIGDAVYIINYIFGGGAGPLSGCVI
jgi:hypothetical protein